MISCLIIDDEPLSRDVLRTFVKDHPALTLVGECRDAMEALKMLQEASVDLLLLDINMPQLSGLNFYRSLAHKPQVIFITAYPDYAVEGFEVNATDYLMKPVSFERFYQAIEKVKEKAENEGTPGNSIMLKVDKKLYRIETDDILFCEAIGDYVKVYTNEKVLIVSSTLKGLLAELPDYPFLRTHKSYIINTEQFEYIEGNRVIIREHRIPIGQAFRDEVFQALKT